MSSGVTPRAVRVICWSLAAATAGALVGACTTWIGTGHRWMLWYSSPNDLAAVACAVIVIATAALTWSVGCASRGLRLTVGSASTAILAVALACLMGSCSRGGLLAALVAVAAFAALVGRGRRATVLLVLLATLVAAVSSSRMSGRVAAVAEPGGDRSITCRVDLARAAAAMIADRPRGSGVDAFGDAAARWYLDTYRGRVLATPLNDVLLAAAERGLLVTTVWLSLYLALTILLLRLALARTPASRSLPAAAACVLIGVAVQSQTTTLTYPASIPGHVLGAVLAALAIAIWLRPDRGSIGQALLVGVAMSLLTALGVWSWGRHVADGMPWRPLDAQQLAVEPRGVVPRARFLVVGTPGDDDGDVCRNVLRRLAEHGCAAEFIRIGAPRTSDAPRVLLGLRGASAALGEAIFSGALPAPLAVVLIDRASEPGPAVRLPCPVFAVEGSADSPTLPLDQLSAQPTRSTSLAAPVGYCWPRHFHTVVVPVVEWAARLRIDQPDSATER